MGTRGEFKVAVTKEDLVFASAHFITLSGHRCEALHGHNYRAGAVVEGRLELESWFVLDFVALKRVMKRLTDELDHRVLLPRDNEAAVTRIRDYIAAGDVYQVNLAQRFRTPFTGPALELYRRLRARSPAPFGAYLELGDVAVTSISPERFLRLDGATRTAEARPIKGTRPRGVTPVDDAALAAALTASEKDRAENVMIVDLLRNDLGKVCRPGSVRVLELCALESHPTVHHLVSTVTGVLADGADAFNLVGAAFPGGSVTGAPKIRAMEIIAELERAPRGVYCGAIGYVSVTGAMDLNIPIRTVVLQNGVASFHAGAGIVWDSDPSAEYDETLAKAGALIDALTSPRKTSRTRGPARRPA
jgi:para-aminobenzoate synthetase component 1